MNLRQLVAISAVAGATLCGSVGESQATYPYHVGWPPAIRPHCGYVCYPYPVPYPSPWGGSFPWSSSYSQPYGYFGGASPATYPFGGYGVGYATGYGSYFR